MHTLKPWKRSSLFLAAAFCAGLSSLPVEAKLAVNGGYLNGIQANGIQANGRIPNGVSPNGRFLNGGFLDGRFLNGRFLNGGFLNGTEVDGLSGNHPAGEVRVLGVTLPDGTLLKAK